MVENERFHPVSHRLSVDLTVVEQMRRLGEGGGGGVREEGCCGGMFLLSSVGEKKVKT